MVEIEPEVGSGIPVWRTSVCQNRSSYTSVVNWDYVDEIWFADRLYPSEGSDINKYETGSSI